MRTHFAYLTIILALIVGALQVGHNREAIGIFVGRLEECSKIVNSDNYSDPNARNLTFDERWAMKKHCDHLAQNELHRQNEWFWSAPKKNSNYAELWHY
jgi:hypothetical protein